MFPLKITAFLSRDAGVGVCFILRDELFCSITRMMKKMGGYYFQFSSLIEVTKSLGA